MESSELSDICLICGKPNALRCGGCKDVRYCSKSCQRADFPIHKLLCARFSDFDMTKRPTKEHMRAILFPVDEKKPKLVWVECKWDGNFQSRNTKPFLDGDNGMSTAIDYNPILGRRVSNVVYVVYRDSFLFDGSAPNNSIATITATKSEPHHDWRGPMIAYAMVGMDFESATECRDIDLNDFRHVSDYFISYGTRFSPTPSTLNSIKIKGVKINCTGEQEILKKPHFEEIEVDACDIILADHDTSDIARFIGLPIMTKRCSPDPRWANIDRTGAYNNQDATFLHLCCDPKAKRDEARGVLGWGWAPERWQSKVGSVIVVRRDQKPLSRWHVEALCRYCRLQVGKYMAHSIGEFSDEPMSKDMVLSMICRPTFSVFWSTFTEEKWKNRDSSDDPTSPYVI
ncbi:hypothetical protein F5Y09DRAFT_352356 [Xylaria sp. FL1042]|nr:hypothetical protein F5Y09DRAFT_352356 [Xylaria sp. FL1042]